MFQSSLSLVCYFSRVYEQRHFPSKLHFSSVKDPNRRYCPIFHKKRDLEIQINAFMFQIFGLIWFQMEDYNLSKVKKKILNFKFFTFMFFFLLMVPQLYNPKIKTGNKPKKQQPTSQQGQITCRLQTGSIYSSTYHHLLSTTFQSDCCSKCEYTFLPQS